MKARWSLAGLALAAAIWAPAVVAQRVRPPQQITLSIANIQ
jgi:hypothetical protein